MIVEQHLADNHDVAHGVVERALAACERGRDESAACYAMIAADLFWHNHAGTFASPELETMLSTLAGRLPDTPRLAHGQGDVLHVLTRAYPIGGHTRLARRWIEQDDQRSHSVLLTHQGRHAPPAWLSEAVTASGGEVLRIDAMVSGLRNRAAALRAIATGYEQLVVHSHPDDVIPLMAFADASKRPPVVFVNHADHVFWLGVAIGDVIANLRRSADVLSLERRGIEASRIVRVPIPIDTITRHRSQTDAKATLGVADNQVLAISVAAPYKFTPLDDDSDILSLFVELVEAHPQLVVRIAGPSPEGRWARAQAATDGRLQAVGPVEDAALYYQAADLYFDSFPLTSATSILEAGAFGAPPVALRPAEFGGDLFQLDAPSLEAHACCFESVEDYKAQVERLVEHAEERRELGEAVAASVLATHSGAGWIQTVHDAYRASKTRGAMPPDPLRCIRSQGSLDRKLALVHAHGRFSYDAAEAYRRHMRLLKSSDRVATWLRLAFSGGSPKLRFLLKQRVRAR